MSSEIPDYYKHFTEQPPSEPAEENEADPSSDERRGMPIPESSREPRTQKSSPDVAQEFHGRTYQADSFSVDIPEDWTDRTVFTLVGPVTDGVTHNITVIRQSDLETDSLEAFADLQIQSLESELKGCRLLLREPVRLASDEEAYRAIFVWWPTEEKRLYQEQIYVLHEGTGFTLTASFSKKSRKTIGPLIERAMLTFRPSHQDTW